MILQCPQCQARYLVPDGAIGASGRTVRCGKCQHNWFAAPTEESAKALDELDQMLDQINVAPKPIPAGSNLPVVGKRKASILLKLSTLLTGTAAVALLLVWLAPGLVKLPRSQGLMLGEVAIHHETDDKHNYYQLSGKIVNTSKAAKTVPTLRVTLVDDDGMSLQYWDFGGKGKTIAPSQSLPFSTGKLAPRGDKGTRFVLDLGNPLEMALRSKPAPAPQTEAAPTPKESAPAAQPETPTPPAESPS